MFRRQDLSVEDRISRSRAIFQTLAGDQTGPFHVQSAYFIGVGYVRLKQWDQALAQFLAVTQAEARDDKERAVQELAELSMGRVYFEVGKYDEAIDRYARIGQQSDSFPDSLYEIAWSYVRKGELERAKNATEVLLLVAEDSVLAPEAKILQGTLLQKLQKYDDAIDTYNQVINTYSPVRDEIDALLTVNKDPVQYFDELLARNEKTLDVTRLLPPVALKWASTRQEVAEAVEITSALDASPQGHRGVRRHRRPHPPLARRARRGELPGAAGGLHPRRRGRHLAHPRRSHPDPHRGDARRRPDERRAEAAAGASSRTSRSSSSGASRRCPPPASRCRRARIASRRPSTRSTSTPSSWASTSSRSRRSSPRSASTSTTPRPSARTSPKTRRRSSRR